jgi:large subunit ribosomal protein L25
MNKHILKADKREVLGSKVKSLRKLGIIPTTIFGKTIDSVSAQISAVEFNRVYKKAGETSLIWISIEGESKERPTLVKTVTFDPVKGTLLHVDFHQVNLKEKVTANVPVEFIGESLLVKDGLAVLDTHLDELEVEALPTDIPEKIIFDISTLLEVGDHLNASVAVLPAGVTLLTDPEALIVALGELQKEEEPLDTTVVEAEVEGATSEEEKIEGATPAESKPKE